MEAAAHCTVYYSEGKNLQQVEAGTRIIRTTAGPYGIVFFAAPEEGYALTVLAAVSTQQKYYTISNWSDDGSGMTAAEQAACDEYVDALKDHAGFTDEQLRSMVSQARALGCDGSLMFTRGADNSYGINSTLQFRAERLPTLEKEILSVTGADGVETPYQPGMSVGAGDVVTYGLTVTAYALEYPVDSVYYTGVTVTDPKTGNGAEDPIPFTLPGKKELMELKEDREITREVTYTVTQADADAGTLSNEAQLHFQYASIYSAGSLSTTSSAQATVLVRSPVRYAYVSADPDLELPWELANLAPADPAAYDYQAEVTALGHDVMIWEDRERQGTWTLTAGGRLGPGGDGGLPRRHLLHAHGGGHPHRVLELCALGRHPGGAVGPGDRLPAGREGSKPRPLWSGAHHRHSEHRGRAPDPLRPTGRRSVRRGGLYVQDPWRGGHPGHVL